MNTSVSIQDYDAADISKMHLEPQFLFPNFEKSTQTMLFKLLTFVNFFSYYSDVSRSYFSIFGFFVNLIHFWVLTRKSMRNNAINIILAIMAINDMCTVVHAFLTPVQNGSILDRKNPNLIYVPRYQFMCLFFAGIFKRNYSWLPIFMAATRAKVMKNYADSDYAYLTTGKFGLSRSAAIVAVNSVLAVIIHQWTTFDNFPECITTQCVEIEQTKKYYRLRMDSFKTHDLINDFINSVIPAFCYPISTFVLIRELRKARSQTLTAKDSNNTTKMIVTMTVFAIIPQFVQVISNTLMVFTFEDKGFNLIGEFLAHTVYTLTSINSSAHCFICYIMSSSYRTEFNKPFKYSPNNTTEVDIETVN